MANEGESPLPHSSFSHYPSIPPPLNLRLTELPPRPCPYLPGRTAIDRAFWAEEIPGELYRQFMDASFRRSGKVVYQPICHGCRKCVQIRVPVDRFTPSKSQRRCWRKNSDVLVEISEPVVTAEKFRVYQAYSSKWHEAPLKETDESFRMFLYDSPVHTLEFAYRDVAGKLLGVGICDVDSESLSSVYFYFDPAEARRGLGTYAALYELEYAKLNSLAYYYLGYWVDGCRTMEYKANYRPHELLGTDGRWREVADMHENSSTNADLP